MASAFQLLVVAFLAVVCIKYAAADACLAEMEVCTPDDACCDGLSCVPTEDGGGECLAAAGGEDDGGDDGGEDDGEDDGADVAEVPADGDGDEVEVVDEDTDGGDVEDDGAEEPVAEEPDAEEPAVDPEVAEVPAPEPEVAVEPVDGPAPAPEPEVVEEVDVAEPPLGKPVEPVGGYGDDIDV